MTSLLPVTVFTCAIPWESRRMTPICDGARETRCQQVLLRHALVWRRMGGGISLLEPFLASLHYESRGQYFVKMARGRGCE